MDGLNLRMGLSHLDEVRALLQTHHDEGVPTSLAGYSMAGQLGGHAVATLPFEVPVVVMAAPPSADVVFIDGPLSTQLRWPALGDGAQEKLRDVMTRLDLLKVPAPVSKKRAVVVTAVDGIVSPQASARIAGHWGVMPHTVRSGHLGAYVFHRRALQQLITETVLPR